MINPVGDASLSYTFSSDAKSSSRTASPSASSTTVGDVVSISPEALKAQFENVETAPTGSEKADSGDSGSQWSATAYLEEGTFTLDNGNEQKITIDGNKLEILEFENGKLVKSVTGTITSDGASLDTEYYDAGGDIVQSIHTEITELEGENGWSSASMSRSAQWFEDGQLKGELQDTMLLNTKNNGVKVDGEDGAERIRSLLKEGTEKVVPSVEALQGKVTMEDHIASYHADVREYGLNGRLAREITLEHEGRYRQVSNRSFDEIGNLPERTTRELSHNTDFSLTIRDYDENGDLVMDASLRDQHKDDASSQRDGRMSQTLSISWYNKGELVKQSHGSFSLEEIEGHKLPKRPGILDVLNLSTEEYLGDEPQSAVDLLNENYLEGSSEPEFFMESINSLAGKGAYNTAKGIADYGNPEQPYAIDWTDELYRDGEMVMRKRDVEGARETLFSQREKALQFRIGHALTENDAPTVVQETSHEVELFEGGNVIDRQYTKARESLNPDLEEGNRLVTNLVVEQGPEGKETTTSMKAKGELTEIDQDPNAAARGFSGQMKQTLDSMHATTGSMNYDEVERKETLLVNFDYNRLWD